MNSWDLVTNRIHNSTEFAFWIYMENDDAFFTSLGEDKVAHDGDISPLHLCHPEDLPQFNRILHYGSASKSTTYIRLQTENINWTWFQMEGIKTSEGSVGLLIRANKRIEFIHENKELLKTVKSLLEKNKELEHERIKSKLTEEILKKDAELALAALKISTRNETLIDLQSSLKNSGPESQTLSRQISQSLSSDSSLNEFEYYFAKVHPRFSQILLDRHPKLSDRELKMCILLRLGLASKDIAMVTHLSLKSVEIYRYNIRKKLNLKRGDNLVIYLRNLDNL